MTEKKHNPNPFIRMAQEAKERNLAAVPVITGGRSTEPKMMSNPVKAGPVAKVMKKSGRGG